MAYAYDIRSLLHCAGLFFRFILLTTIVLVDCKSINDSSILSGGCMFVITSEAWSS